MAKDPARRPPDAGALADALEEVLAAPGVSSLQLRAGRSGLAAAAAILASLLLIAVVRVGRDADPTPGPAANAPVKDERAARRAERRRASGSADLSSILRIRGSAEQIAGLDRWLAEFPDHPQRRQALSARDHARMSAPLLSLRREGLCAAEVTDRYIIVADVMGGVVLHRPSDGQELASFKLPARAFSMAATPDGRLLAARCAQQLLVYELPSAKVVATRSLPEAVPNRARITADGTLVAISDHARHTVSLYRMPGLEPAGELASGRAQVLDMAFSPDGRRLGLSYAKGDRVGDAAGTLWADLQSEHPRALAQGGDPYRSTSVAVSPDGSWLAVGNSVGAIVLLSQERSLRLSAKDLELPELAGETLKQLDSAHAGSVRALAFSPDGRRLYSICDKARKSGELRVWDVERGEQLLDGPDQPLLPTHWPRPLMGLSLASDGRSILLWSDGGFDVAELWALPELNETR